jgi:hypothetical protein
VAVRQLPDGTTVSVMDVNGITITRYSAPGTKYRPDTRVTGRSMGQMFANLGSRSCIATDEFGIEYEVGQAPIFATYEDWEKAVARRERC